MRANELERTLREFLDGVQLVCDANIPEELLAAAEAEMRPRVNDRRIEVASASQAATLVTYFVMRGSARYRGNSVWPQLGVLDNSHRAGEAFLTALRHLELPTFEKDVRRVRARRFVAPMLIHGAFPATAAARLVERVEQELRRGIVDAKEARSRLLASPDDLISAVGRPAARLIAWAPTYSERLLDAVIDHIEDPDGGAESRLPSHIVRALSENTERRIGLKRLVLPQLLFDTWTGFGPEIVAPQRGGPWGIRLGLDRHRLRAGEEMEVPPDDNVVVEAAGHRKQLWSGAGDAWVFDGSGRLLTASDEPQDEVIVLALQGVHVQDGEGETPPIIEDGVPLSGAWSGFWSRRYDIRNRADLCVVQDDRVLAEWGTASEPEISISGDVVDHATGRGGSQVFREVPHLVVSDGIERVWVDFDSVAGGRVRITAEIESSELALDSLIDSTHPIDGRLKVRSATTDAVEAELTFVPGLRFEMPTHPLGPSEAATIIATADPSVLQDQLVITAPMGAAVVEVPVEGLDPGGLQAHLPRVQWGLKSSAPERLDLAPNVIRTELSDLTQQPTWLLVRVGRPASVGLELSIAGVHKQTLVARQTKQTAVGSYQTSISLEPLRDTLRAQAGSHAELSIVVDSSQFVAVECGERNTADQATRSWGRNSAAESSVPMPAGRLSNDDAFWGLQVPSRLDDQLDDNEALIWFLSAVGDRSQSWAISEFPDGRSAREWSALNQIADQRWNLDALRFRRFASDEPLERLRSWARVWGDRLELADWADQWQTGEMVSTHPPPPEAFTEWRHSDWIIACLPTNHREGLRVGPAVLLYNLCLALSGREGAAARVAALMEHQADLVMEGLAFIMDALRRVATISPPPEPLPVSIPAERPATPCSSDASDVRPLASASEVLVEADEHEIQLLHDADVRVPALRLSVDARAVAVVRTRRADGISLAEIPPDVHGDVGVEIIEGTMLGNVASPDLIVPITPAPDAVPPGARSTDSLSELKHMNMLYSVDRISLACATDRLSEAPIEEFFEDELAAGTALYEFARSCDDPETINRTAIAVLPSALLFNRLLPSSHDSRDLLGTSQLMYAALTSRDRHGWSNLGWPANAKLEPTRSTIEALTGWAHRLATPLPDEGITTWRYSESSNIPHADQLRTFIRGLERSGTDERFTDLVVATHRMLAVDALTQEAMRMILDAYDDAPKATTSAILAGTAAHLITSN